MSGENILNKLNESLENISEDDTAPVTLSDVMVVSYSEWEEVSADILTWEEQTFVYQEAEEEHKQNIQIQSQVLSRANPVLANAVRLGIAQSAMRNNYDKLFGTRATEFTRPGSVSSMFSPAAYLTELYRETHDLYPPDSSYHLANRRPDLAKLVLSQRNMDEEISTLALSNDMLMQIVEAENENLPDGVLEMLSTYRQTGGTPYHQPYETIRQSIILQDEHFTAFVKNPDVTSRVDTSTLNAIRANISPELFTILTEEITDGNAAMLVKRNFGDVDISAFKNVALLGRFYGISHDEMSELLAVMLPNQEFVEGQQYYQNDQLITMSENNGTLEAHTFKRTYGQNGSQFGYVELLPVSGNNYLLRFTVRIGAAGPATQVRIGTTGTQSSDIFRGTGIIPGHNIPATVPVTLTQNTLTNGITFGVTRYNPNGTFAYAIVTFRQNVSSFNLLLLKLNKLIRLYRATGISPANLRAVMDTAGQDLNINDETLSQLFWVKQYMQHYGVGRREAMALSGSTISQIAYGNDNSDFDFLFNIPALGGNYFSADGTSLGLRPTDTADTFRTGVLKRAFQVNDAELFTLWCLARGTTTPPAFTCTIENISALYRLALMVFVHHLSISELSMLVSVSPYASVPLGSLSRQQLTEANVLFYLITEWLNTQGLSAGELFMMTTTRHSPDMTPDIESLIVTLQNGLANQPPDVNDEARINMAAPFIAAAAQLDSNETAVAVLIWINQIRPAGLTVTQFLTLVEGFSTSGNNNSLVSFCQTLAQLTLIVRSLGLSAEEVTFAVSRPGTFLTGTATLSPSLLMVRSLGRFHRWLQQCGNAATEILSSLRAGTLSASRLALAMGLDENIVAQGLAQQNASASAFTSWVDIDVTLQWVNVSGLLGITPSGIAALMSLKYQQNNMQPYSRWNEISNTMQAGLNERQTTALQAALAESLSHALSTYAIKNLSPVDVMDRDDLYSWLLLDNQVSADVKTTRLAEAIASIQLYVNRGLHGQEEMVSDAVRSRRFLRDWDTWNKRYSTWSGVSRLVYYPENYIDPAMRIGQTGMMDEMLQSLSQSQLNSNTVEDTFKTYMTRFEEVANLEVVSGYHDSSSSRSGMMYLIGHQATAGKYYWRTLDHDKEQYGQFPANAWSEWREITTAAMPFNGQIRPVVFNSRLYVVWLEQREISSSDGQSRSLSYELRYSFLRHDGTWSEVSSVALDEHFSGTEISRFAPLNLYCSRSADTGAMVVLFYSPQTTSEANRTTPVQGLLIDAHHEARRNTAASAARDYLWKQLNTTTIKHVSQLNAPGVSAPNSVTLNYGWGHDSLSIMSGGSVQNVRVTGTTDTKVTLLADINVRVIYNGQNGTRTRFQVDLMKRFGNMGDSFFIYNGISINPDHNQTRRIHTPVYRMAANGNTTPALLVHRTDGASGLSAWLPGLRGTLTSTSREQQVSMPVTGVADAQFIGQYIFIQDGSRTATDVHSGYTIRTAIDPRTVRVDVSVAGVTTSFKAQEHINASELPVQNFNGTVYRFRNVRLTVPRSAFLNNQATLNFSLSAQAVDGRSLGRQQGTLTLTQTVGESALQIVMGSESEQYLQKGAYRTRLNTLFARKLVARARQGLNAVLSMETQQMQEPMLGLGCYVDVRFPRYSRALHGDGWFILFVVGARDNPDGSNNRTTDIIASGHVSNDEETTVRVFVPFNTGLRHEPHLVYLGVQYSDVTLMDTFRNMQSFEFQPSTGLLTASSENLNRTRGLNSFVLDDRSEPMDFRGSNALYFWEMFYYVPMMAFSRLLAESRFTEATQWIKYIWDPEGYLVDGQRAPYQWNVRPLEEDTSWNESPLDSVDPDAVAQADPMHYKVATFMAYLDMLIARGDMAYRKLERDTLNEAKMWYVQALNILGHKPFLSTSDGWSNPQLENAADKVRQVNTQEALMAVRDAAPDAQPRTANSLLDLFLPQYNEKLVNYWQTLEQRLFNLRNNMSIDGQPLSLPIFASPASPDSLLSAAVSGFRGGSSLPGSFKTVYRFPVMLRNAREMAEQLAQFGTTLLSLTERQDESALSVMFHTHGMELMHQGIALQDKTIEEIDADRKALEENRLSTQQRFTHFTRMCDEDVSAGERHSMELALASSVLASTAIVPYTVAAALDMMPNIWGFAFGGTHFGAVAQGVGAGIEITAGTLQGASDRVGQSEAYRRRLQEWELERDTAESELKEVDAHLATLAIRCEAAVMQKAYLETEYGQARAQHAFIQGQFTGEALYSWLRGRLAAIYYQFYDLTVSRCLMAEEAYRWTTGNDAARFIRPGAWQGTCAGLMAAETLKLNLTQMEQAFLRQDEREKEVTRTVSMADLFRGLSGGNSFSLADRITEMVASGQGSAGTDTTGLRMSGGQLQAMVRLSDLNIMQDYPASLGSKRRIRQVSITLPALMGPYQDIRAVLSYGGSVVLPQGCNAQVVSHGMDDNGQFQLNFNDERWMPFEGIPVNDRGALTLSFPDAANRQKALLETLSDIIMHIRYTITG
ncbi:neuraminidase-like domain-containing protein [Enterobacter asburiae]